MYTGAVTEYELRALLHVANAFGYDSNDGFKRGAWSNGTRSDCHNHEMWDDIAFLDGHVEELLNVTDPKYVEMDACMRSNYEGKLSPPSITSDTSRWNPRIVATADGAFAVKEEYCSYSANVVNDMVVAYNNGWRPACVATTTVTTSTETSTSQTTT